MYMYICMCICVCIWMLWMTTCLDTYKYNHIYIHTRVYMLHVCACVCICVPSKMTSLCMYTYRHVYDMGWLRSVGSIKLQVSFAEYSLFHRALLQKRPMILSILLT